jgi:uncharacterized membrane protein YphA (DoxX/SURF4 family)
MIGGAASAGVAQLLAAQLAAFLAVLLIASTAHKWLRFEHARGVVREFGRVPAGAAAWVVIAAGVAELSAAGMLLAPAHRRTGATLAASILCVYLALIARAIAQGRRDVDCGCSLGGGAHSLGAFELARNASLVVSACIVAVSAQAAAAPQPSQLLAACSLLTLYVALDQVMGLRAMRRGVVL